VFRGENRIGESAKGARGYVGLSFAFLRLFAAILDPFQREGREDREARPGLTAKNSERCVSQFI
jgi:hypothetical protein